MSDSDAVDTPDESQNNDEMHFIAEKVKMYPEILEKSQVPTMKLKKKRALEGIIQDYKAIFGKAITEKDFMKKVNNMKTRLKKKTDRNQTGNRPIRLLPWENIMLETMQGDKNPVVSRISGGLQIGVTPQSVNTSQPGSSVVPSPPLDVVESKSRSITPKVLDVRKRIAEAAPIRHIKKVAAKGSSTVDKIPEESEETRTLTTSQLQRLILLEQLKATRLQQEYFTAKLEDKAGSFSRLTKPVSYFQDGNQTFANLQ